MTTETESVKSVLAEMESLADSDNHGIYGAFRAFATRIAAAHAREVEGLAKDAGRYRWLRLALSDRSRNGRSHHFCSIPEGRPNELDADIDAAMGEPVREVLR